MHEVIVFYKKPRFYGQLLFFCAIFTAHEGCPYAHYDIMIKHADVRYWLS